VLVVTFFTSFIAADMVGNLKLKNGEVELALH
jgi:hypothetical protein